MSLQTPRACIHVERSVHSFTVVGGVKAVDFGTFAQYVVVDRDQIIPTPDHLDDVHAAAWPVGGVTAWR